MAAKGVYTTSDPLEYDDYIRLIDELERAGKYRWELFCILSCAFALRASDVLKIKWGDVLCRDMYVLNEHKTGKPRRITINEAVREKISYIYERMGRPKLKSLIFLSKRTGKPYTLQDVNYHLRNYRKKYELPINRFSSHSFRKTFGMKFFNEQGGTERALIILNRIFNHSTVEITQRYLGIKNKEYQAPYESINF